MDTAIDVAGHIVRSCIDKGRPTTSMKLHRLLYLSWIEFHREKGGFLFDDEFHAWKFGPVVEPVYKEFRIFAAMPIWFIGKPYNLDGETSAFMDSFMERYDGCPQRDIITHILREGGAWDRHYDDRDRGRIIPFGDIISLECRADIPKSGRDRPDVGLRTERTSCTRTPRDS